jgi:hypothetical protein
MSQSSYNHLVLRMSRAKSRTESKESTRQILFMRTAGQRTTSNAKGTLEQETPRSIAQSLTALEAIKNLSSYL